MTDSEIQRLISESERRLARQINVLKIVILGMALSFAHSLYETKTSWGVFIIESVHASVRSLQRQNRGQWGQAPEGALGTGPGGSWGQEVLGTGPECPLGTAPECRRGNIDKSSVLIG